jgi:ABC-type nickel/cobalt efflux system permease component RcnA
MTVTTVFHVKNQPRAIRRAEPGLVALAVSGGLLPSPSAFMVLVTGLLTGRAVDAVVLVLAFGTGMAATLTGVGVATIKGVAVLTTKTRRWSSKVAAWTPAMAGVAVAMGGAVYLTVAIATLT